MSEQTIKCVICGRECSGKYSCNGAVLGDYIELKGHKTCIDNVDNLVVIPNRIRFMGFERYMRGKIK